MVVRHLYVHVPFCLRRCSYCDFAVHATRRPPVEAWLDAIPRELELLHADMALHLELDTLYIGGGTPSLLGGGAMGALHEGIARHADVSRVREFTAEANPENVDAGLMADWIAAGINRVSIGIQTFHEPALRWMGRLHGANGGIEAFRAARDAGMDNISVDLIFALPDKLGRDWSADLDRAIGLEAEHISLYGLSAEPQAALGRWVREGRAVMAADDRYADEYLLAAETLGRAGYHHYEVSNFARPGYESLHNRAYWNGSAYLGLGSGAHSLIPPRRLWNVRGWPEYQAALAEGRLPREESETVEGSSDELERIWLGLRTDEGAPVNSANWSESQRVEQWRRAGWATLKGSRVVLTPTGWLLLDQLAVELDAVRSA